MVLYFSGTGNSRYVAERVAAAAGMGLFSINSRLKARDYSAVNCPEDIVIVSPVYAWRLPEVVTGWLMKTGLTGSARAWFILTCGSETGNADRYNRQLCEKTGLSYMGTASIVMPENYIAMFNAPGKEKAREIIEKAEPSIITASETVKLRQPFPKPHFNLMGSFTSTAVNPLFYRWFVKADGFFTNDTCNLCGACVRNCPLNNISVADGKVRWGSECTHCMACICLCPREAIEYGKRTAGKPRYHL